MRAPRLAAFVAVVVVLGAAVLGRSVVSLLASPFNPYVLMLAVATIIAGRFYIKVPGRAATVSVSEVFVFTSVLLFGPAPATVTVAIDGLWTSVRQQHRRLDRTLFNVAEPALSTWTAACVFFAVARPASAAGVPPTAVTIVASLAMAALFFALNSGLTAIALALESGASASAVWRRHARSLAVNYYAAASIAALAVNEGGGVDFGAVALIVPLLILSYVAYQEASTRVDEAQRHVDDLERLHHAATEMLAIAVDSKDQVTHGHIRRVQQHTLAVAATLGITDARELKAIEAGALLHDIGKLAVPDYVLNKPSQLTPAEFEVMKTHPAMGARILTAVDFPYPIVPIVRHHHEQWDGRGYPDGLAREEIPIGARILAVVDCFDALTSDRPYRPRLADAAAIRILRERSGTFYDPAVVEKFVELVPMLRHDVQPADRSDARHALVAGLAEAAGDIRRNRGAERRPGAVPVRIVRWIDLQLSRSAGVVESCLFVVNPEADVLTVAHATPGIADHVASLRIPFGTGVSGWVAANRSTIPLADATLDLGGAAAFLGLHSCISSPVFCGGELFGVFTAYAPGPGPLPRDTVHGVTLLAQEIGLALARAEAEREEASFTVPVRARKIAAVS